MAKLYVDENIRNAIKAFVNAELAGCGVTGVSITADYDHSGDESLFITVDYDNEGDDIDLNKLSGMTTKLREKPLDGGEERFPFIRNHFSDLSDPTEGETDD